MNENKKKTISSMGLLSLYIVISIIMGILFGITSLTSNSVVICINTITTSLVFWTIVKHFFILDKLSVERFLKNTIIILTFLCVGLVTTKSIDGYNEMDYIYTTLHVAFNTIENEYKENPDQFEGYGFAEDCKSWVDIEKAEKNTLNDWIAHYFISPIVPTCVYLLASIASLNVFTVINSLVKMKNNEKDTNS